MGVPGWVWLLTGWVALEALLLAVLDYVHRRTGIYYLPRGRPRLSRQATAVLERLVANGGRGAVMEHSPTLGWTLSPNVTSADGRVHSNARGLRSTRETDPMPAPGMTRVLTLGDCLTFGGGVSDDFTFQRSMEKINPALDVLNFGVDGYGPVQMLLRYRESAAWCRDHRFAILCMSSPNVFKPLNAFRPFMAYNHGLPFGLPRAVLRNGQMEILPNPLASLDDYRRLLADPDRELQRIGATDHYYLDKFAWSPADVLPSVRMVRTALGELRKVTGVMTLRGVYHESSTALATTLGVLDTFADDARAREAHPIVAVMPSPRDVRVFVSRGIYPSVHIMAGLREHGIDSVDLLEDLGPAARDHGYERVFAGRHYSEFANDVVARRLLAVMGSAEARVDVSAHAATHTHAGMLRGVRDP